jgi:hypothetical protein
MGTACYVCIGLNTPFRAAVTHFHLTAFRGFASTTPAYVGTIWAFQNQSSFQTSFSMVLRVIYCEEFPTYAALINLSAELLVSFISR